MLNLKTAFLIMADLFLCLTVFTAGLLLLPFILSYLFFHKIKRINTVYLSKKRLLLFSESADFESLKAKGTLSLLNNFLCGGYFEKVYVVHFPCPKTQKIRLNDSLEIIEIGRKARFLRDRNLIWSYTLLNSLYYFWKVFRMRGFVLENISVIQGAGVHHTGLATLFLHWLTNLPACVSVHSDDEHRYKLMKDYGAHWKLFGSRWFTVKVQKFVFSHSPLIFIVRPSLKDWAIRSGASPDRIRLYPHGIDLKKFFKIYTLDLKKEFDLLNRYLIIFSGRLSNENYVYDILKIAAMVKTNIPNILFLMIGDGPERKRMEDLALESDLTENVRFLGFLPQDKVFEFRKIADVNLCLMAGYSLIEAALSGKPIIAYDVEWHRELIKNGQTGFLVPEHNILLATDAINKLIENPDLARRLGEGAKKSAIEMHDSEKIFKVKTRLYEELTDQPLIR